MIKSDREKIQSALDRLRGITGFVTTLCYDYDKRASVFNRYNHINRVWLVNQFLCDALKVNSDQSNEIVFLHDLNRWPFAQNSETGYFDQAGNVREFLLGLNAGISTAVMDDIEMMHEKRLYAMSEGSRYAFLSDIICGLVEDPLLLITALNIHPEIIPDKFREMLDLDFSDQFMIRLKEICYALNADKNIDEFSRLFHQLFEMQYKKLITKYIERYNSLEEIAGAIFQDSMLIKADFLRPIIFPINNEAICHGSWIRKNVISPLIQEKGEKEASSYLLSVDEYGLLEYVLKTGYIETEEAVNLYPDLDYSLSNKCKYRNLIAIDR